MFLIIEMVAAIARYLIYLILATAVALWWCLSALFVFIRWCYRRYMTRREEKAYAAHRAASTTDPVIDTMLEETTWSPQPENEPEPWRYGY